MLPSGRASLCLRAGVLAASQLDEIRAAVDEYSSVGIWEVENGPSGEPVITFYDHCLPF